MFFVCSLDVCTIVGPHTVACEPTCPVVHLPLVGRMMLLEESMLASEVARLPRMDDLVFSYS